MNKKTVLALGGAAVMAAFLVSGFIAIRAMTKGQAATAGAWAWDLPPGFPEPYVPADNAMSEVKFQLGRHLFFDKRLSGNGSMSCGSCHLQRLAFTDGRALASGSTGV